jgi:hypothetical protein
MTDKIIQGSEAWLEAKQSTIGASEIYTLIYHYCKDELQQLGIDIAKERPFRTIQEMFLKVKFGAKLSAIDPVYSEFGNGMELYVAYRLKQKLSQIKVERTQDFIVNENLHKLAACSPDGYVELVNNSYKLPDFDKTCEIDNSWGKGVLEFKTANYFENFKADEGAKLQYIFQHQFQMAVTGLKWGVIAVLMPKEEEFDEPFFKGKILRSVEIEEWSLMQPEHDRIAQFYDLKHYIYPKLPVFQALILKALAAFQFDLDTYETDQSVFPRVSEDLIGLQREKQLWAQLQPEKYGSLALQEQDKLNQLLNERFQARTELMFAEQAKLKIENEINQEIYQQGLGKYTEIKGIEQRLIWDKKGSLRFYKNK